MLSKTAGQLCCLRALSPSWDLFSTSFIAIFFRNTNLMMELSCFSCFKRLFILENKAHHLLCSVKPQTVLLLSKYPSHFSASFYPALHSFCTGDLFLPQEQNKEHPCKKKSFSTMHIVFFIFVFLYFSPMCESTEKGAKEKVVKRKEGGREHAR